MSTSVRCHADNAASSGSTYTARKDYLHAMKQFLADAQQNVPHVSLLEDIEQYFQYEQEMSVHIQELVGKFKPSQSCHIVVI